MVTLKNTQFCDNTYERFFLNMKLLSIFKKQLFVLFVFLQLTERFCVGLAYTAILKYRILNSLQLRQAI